MALGWDAAPTRDQHRRRSRSDSFPVDPIAHDARYWHDHAVYRPDELAARLHAQLVAIHPFPNGNGRATRLIADLYLTSIDQPAFSWGAATLDVEGTVRQRYLDALIGALQTDDYELLIAFGRS